MTDITDQQRREVAERMRRFEEDGSPAATIYGGGEAYDQMLVRVLRDVIGGGDLFERLADLIDRPACRVESRVEWDTIDDQGIDYVLSCGHGVTLGACDELRYCPMCGAEVVDA